ncbi:MAG: glycosyltransferase [Deltaproteobacteria bacterium]|nr:glycosyltransferase [Deltaproteobacteria bacterium]
MYWGEAHRVSTWLSALIARLRKKKIIFWGHGIYGNESKLKLFIRKTFYRLAHKHLLYERRVKKLMVANGFKPENLYVVFNSLDYSLHKSLLKKYSKLTRKEVYPFFKNPELPVLVFIGRLTSVKRLDLLLHAVNIINSEKIAVNLLFIGDGPIRASLEKLGQKGMFDSCLHFVGACYSEEKNGKYLFVLAHRFVPMVISITRGLKRKPLLRVIMVFSLKKVILMI